MFRVRYQTFEFDNVDIHIRALKDKMQYQDDDGIAADLGISSATWSFFGVVWDSGFVLANLMFNYEIKGKRILEVGCGIALSSLILNHRNADITATDYHPEANNFLVKNVKLNEGKKIPFVRTGWEDKVSLLGKYDLIIGSDLLYEKEHVYLLSKFIDQHAEKQCEVIIVDPGRGNHASFSKKMVSLGYFHSQRKPKHSHCFKQPFKGKILSYQKNRKLNF